MNCKIPFTKDIDFEKKLQEITSISLEHEIKVEDATLKGNFIVSGDFKSHEVSVNKEPFSYILPFEIALTPNIDPDSIEFMIEDFTYEVLNNSILRVNIDFNVIGSTKENEPDPPFVDTLNVIEDLKKEDEDLRLPIEEKEEGENIMEKEETPNNPVKESNEDAIMNSISATNDEYATYHIHMVNDGETIETICTMYNSNLNILSEYNDLTNLTSGDKLIIPDNNE